MRITLRTALPVLIPIVVLLIWHLRVRRRFVVGRLVLVVGFVSYLIKVADYTIFPLQIDSWYIETFHADSGFAGNINLVPFRYLSVEYLGGVQGWGNVVLGCPFGFILPLVIPVYGWRRMTKWGVVFGATIESLQMVISLFYGFAYRVIDVNDAMLNFVGVVAGYAALRGVASLYRSALGYGPQEIVPEDEGEGLHGYVRSVLFAQATGLMPTAGTED